MRGRKRYTTITMIIARKVSTAQIEKSKNIVLELRTFVLKNRLSTFWFDVLNIRTNIESLSNNFLISIHYLLD